MIAWLSSGHGYIVIRCHRSDDTTLDSPKIIEHQFYGCQLENTNGFGAYGLLASNPWLGSGRIGLISGGFSGRRTEIHRAEQHVAAAIEKQRA